jgi:hypothetical protein
MKVHQPNLPAPEFEHKSLSKTKYADSIVELDALDLMLTTKVPSYMRSQRAAKPVAADRTGITLP